MGALRGMGVFVIGRFVKGSVSFLPISGGIQCFRFSGVFPMQRYWSHPHPLWSGWVVYALMMLWFVPGLSLGGMEVGVMGSSLKTVIAHTVISDPLYRVSCVGDSITKCDRDFDWRTDGYPREGLINRLPALLGSDYDVMDFGVNGACALVVPAPDPDELSPSYSMQPEYALAQQFNPHYVIIMLGINDSNPENWQYNAMFEHDLGEIITTFLNIIPQPPLASPKVILCSPIPGRQPVNPSKLALIRREIVPRVQSLLLDFPTVIGLDCYTPFLDQNGEAIELYFNVDGTPYFYPDGCHLNNTGDDFLAGLIHAAMSEAVDKTPPSTPESPQATILSQTSIRLAWDPSTGSPTGYHVLRDDVVIGLVNSAAYDDTDLPTKGTYRYRVRAFDGSMNLSESSDETLVNTNQLPVLSLIGNKTVRVGETIQFTVSASDGDDSEHTLEYSAVAP